MHNLRLALAFSGLSAALVGLGCTDRNRHPPRQNSLSNITQIGDAVADPARDRVLVTDRIGGRVLAVDGTTGQLEAEVALSTTVTTLATDCCGNRLFVSTPDRSEVAVIDLETFQLVGSFVIPDEPSSMVWKDPDLLLAATDAGIESIQIVDDGSVTSQALTVVTTVLRSDVTAPAELGLSHDQSVLFVAEMLLNNDRVVRIPLDHPQGPLTENSDFTGPVLLLAPSHDDQTLYMATDAGLSLLDPTTLARKRHVDLGSDVRAVVLSKTTTRLFVARGSTVEWVETRKFKFGGEIVAGGGITQRGLMVDPSTTSAVVHTVQSRVETHDLGGTQVHSLPVIRLGEEFNVTLRGTPGNTYQVLFALDPAVQFLDPVGTPDRRFVDLLTQNAFALVAGTFDATGEVTAVWHPQATEPFAGIECLLQVITETPGGALVDVSNPQHLTFIPQHCPDP